MSHLQSRQRIPPGIYFSSQRHIFGKDNENLQTHLSVRRQILGTAAASRASTRTVNSISHLHQHAGRSSALGSPADLRTQSARTWFSGSGSALSHALGVDGEGLPAVVSILGSVALGHALGSRRREPPGYFISLLFWLWAERIEVASRSSDIECEGLQDGVSARRHGYELNAVGLRAGSRKA
jgi:hypothetical protein